MDELTNAVQEVEMDLSFLNSAYEDVEYLRAQQKGAAAAGSRAKPKSGGRGKKDGGPPPDPSPTPEDGGSSS